jgi:predicted phage terminase large subunit-like protein
MADQLCPEDDLPPLEIPDASEEEQHRIASIGAMPYEEFLRTFFPFVASKPLGARHHRLWQWGERLEPGVKPPARIDPWPRGGAKTTTSELLVVKVGCKLSRRFVLLVGASQKSVNRRVQSISAYFGSIGIGRALNEYGISKGWSAEVLRTSHGFNVVGVGLDAASRGIKLEQFRPDWIIVDDIDDQEDSPAVVGKKESLIQNSILPTGSADAAVLVLQNLIHENGVVSRLYDGSAKYLLNREVITLEPAIVGLETESVKTEAGNSVYRITAGTPTWEGQDLATCEAQINEWGLDTFLREAQHKVYGTAGYFFDDGAFEICEPEDVPRLIKLVRAWDLAATQGGGDWTVGVLMGRAPNGRAYVLDVFRDQISPEKVEAAVRRLADEDRAKYGRVITRLPQDPAQAGKAQVASFERLLLRRDPAVPEWKPLPSDAVIFRPVATRKAVNARPWAGRVNGRNAVLVRAGWNEPFKTEHRKFREDDTHDYDDQIDAAADAHNELFEEHVSAASSIAPALRIQSLSSFRK